MEIVCMHCNKILVPEDGDGGPKSHSDCMGYRKPCQESIAYHKKYNMINFMLAKRKKNGLPAFQY